MPSRDLDDAPLSPSGAGDSTFPEALLDDGFEPAEGTSVGRYTVLNTIGRGGAGVVVSAFDPQLDRKVALKFLYRRSASESEHDRLRREAQAIARLAHPNVIRVHDVGTFEGRVFIAIELVDGDDLGAWRARREPGWREVVRVMLAAGEGLAAAHAAGLVHRDFKPRNVLIGADGRPRVTDFGQARGYGSAKTAPRDPTERRDLHGDLPAQDGSMTHTGALAGTLVYMAPEQFDGASPDPRADQWSFCVSLYEMLWGRRPFDDPDPSRVVAAIRAGDVAAPPHRPRVPSGVRRILRRGFSVDPRRRFASMSALLRAMRRTVYWPRRVGVALLPGAVVTAVAVTVWTPGSSPASYCEQQQQRLDELWSPARRAAIERAFSATGREYAETSGRQAAAHIDRSAEAWRGAQRRACEAQSRGDEVGGHLLCLHRRFQELRSLVERLEQADIRVVEHAVEAAGSLPPATTCEHEDEGPRPPSDPEVRRSVERLQAILADARVAAEAGQPDDARALAGEVARRAEALGQRWYQAEALMVQAQVSDDDGDSKPAQEAFQAAFSAGLAAKHDSVVARAAMGAAGLAGRTGRFDEADRWIDLAASAAERRAEPTGSLAAQLELNRGRIDFHRGRFQPALEHFRGSLAREEAAGRDGGPKIGATQLNIGLALSSLGQYDQALVSLEDALARERYHYGDTHPRTVRVLNSLCHVRSYAGQIDAAIEACVEGIATTRSNEGSESPKLVHLYTNFGSVLFRAGRYPETERNQLIALELAEKFYGDDDPMVGNVLNNLGVLYVETKDLDRAQQYYRRALTLFDRTFGADHPTTGILRTNLAMAYSHGGKLEEAEDLLVQSIDVLERTLGADHVDLALSLAELGRIYARRGDHREAITKFERARALREAAGGEPIELADTKYSLAMSRWELGERERTRRLVEQARALYEQAGGERMARVVELDAWLAEHRRDG